MYSKSLFCELIGLASAATVGMNFYSTNFTIKKKFYNVEIFK